MRTISEIAKSLAAEINERFGMEVAVIPSMHYDLRDTKQEEKEGDEPINSWSVIHTKFSIAVKPDGFYLSIKSSESKDWAGPVQGLPGVSLVTSIDQQSAAYKYILADPGSIDAMLGRIEELLNEVSTDSVPTPEPRQSNVGTFGITVGGIGTRIYKRGEEGETPPVRGGDPESD